MKPKTTQPAVAYPIGVTARLTKIHPETLRVWERRYGMIEPVRASRGRRFYSEQDVRRLTMLKSLVDEGHPIGAIARLPIEDLERRLKSTPDAAPAPPGASAGPFRIIVVGEELPILLRDCAEFRIVAAYSDAAQAAVARKGPETDILAWERPALQGGMLGEITRMLSASGAKQAVVVHGFGSRRSIAELEAAGVRCINARSGIDGVRTALRQAAQGHVESPLSTLPQAGNISSIPARRFTPTQLALIADSSPAMACECPRHLAELINGLTAFEQYSAECESRSPADAALHALLHSIAGNARALLETGLERVAEAEGIELKTGSTE